MPQIDPGAIKSVAIIGAGPSGLATAQAKALKLDRYLLAERVFSKVVIYEQRNRVGGVWNYTPIPRTRNSVGKHPANKALDVVTANLPRLNTPMYEGLESNLPHMLMQFSDTPFPEGTQLFATRDGVMDYLQGYAKDVDHLIEFQHTVIDIVHNGYHHNHQWQMTVRNKINETKVEAFDAVVAANGHCDWPLMPHVEGLDEWTEAFPRSLHHSVSYKNAGPFENKRVLLVGGGPSGAEIGNQISAKCKHPLLRSQTTKSPYHTDEPYVRDYPGLVALIPEERAARFADGSIERDIDDVVLCTGYTYQFPFLESIQPDIKREGVAKLPLYQHIFHMHYPTLAFIETPEMIVPFPLAECQAAVVARVWSGRLQLPCQHYMQRWQDRVSSKRGCGRRFHALEPPLDLEYMKEMYEWCKEAESIKSQESGKRGKMPKQWDEKSCWLRMIAAEIKKAFNARGAERSIVKSYEELGFLFEAESVRIWNLLLRAPAQRTRTKEKRSWRSQMMLRLLFILTLAFSSISILAFPIDEPPTALTVSSYTGSLTFNPLDSRALEKRALELPNDWHFVLDSQPLIVEPIHRSAQVILALYDAALKRGGQVPLPSDRVASFKFGAFVLIFNSDPEAGKLLDWPTVTEFCTRMREKAVRGEPLLLEGWLLNRVTAEQMHLQLGYLTKD
ncbi:MAG: hypothetical protein Q9169_001922 [Polycauliona sp. 2 TL-2023]